MHINATVANDYKTLFIPINIYLYAFIYAPYGGLLYSTRLYNIIDRFNYSVIFIMKGK